MDTSRQRLIRLAVVTATAVGVALASPVVAVANDSEVVETATTSESYDPPTVTDPTTEPVVIELVVERTPPTTEPEVIELVVERTPPTTEPEVIELVVERTPPTDSSDSIESPDGAESEEPPEADMLQTATEFESTSVGPSPTIATLKTGSGDEQTGETGGTGETDDDHDGCSGGGHTGCSGSGNPYRMTFVVSWKLPDDSTIPVLEVPADLRAVFDLAAESKTGRGDTTSAHCTYPSGSTDLVCEFQNPDPHASITDGMVVPRKGGTEGKDGYTVTVLWPISGWEIFGANAEKYHAGDVCPGGGGGHGGGGGQSGGGGHDGGHDETVEVAALEETGSVCIHTVVVRKSAVIPAPPAVEPPPQDPPASEVPAVEQAPSQTPPAEATQTPPATEVLPVTVTPRALPATGNTATTTLMIGTIILALGSCLLVLARRRNDLELT